MALKFGKTEEELKAYTQQRMKTLGQGDITDRYSEMIMNLSAEDLSVDKKNPKTLDKMIESGKDKVVKIKLSDLSESPRNCYLKPQGEKREELKASLKTMGQINPIFVRPKELVEEYRDLIENPFEILIGHSRVELLKELEEETGIDEVNAIIVQCDDVQATLLIAQSNIQREKVSEIELARAYRNTYEAMKKDKKANLLVGNSKNENVEISTFSPSCQSDNSENEGKKTEELVAEKYGISPRTLHRKMALAYCIDEVVDFYNKKKFNQEQIQSISKLSADVQLQVCEIMWEEKLKMTNEIAKDLLETWRTQKDEPKMPKNYFPLNILRDVIRGGQEQEEKMESKEKPVKKEPVWKVEIPKKLLPKSIKNEKEVAEYISKALSRMESFEIQ